MKHLTHRLSLLALVAVLPLWAGCDSDRARETVVYGTVLDAQTGLPLKGIPYRLFTAIGGPGSYQSLAKGRTDANGQFTARTQFYSRPIGGVDYAINSDIDYNNKYKSLSGGVKFGSHTITFRLEPQVP